MITELLAAGNIIASLATGTLTEDMLLQYFSTHQAILATNIDQAFSLQEADTLDELVGLNYPKYIENKTLILANYEAYQSACKPVLDNIVRTYGESIPEIVLMPTVGLFSNGGWSQEVDGVHYICIALERLPEEYDIRVLLAHEIGHAVSGVPWSTVLNQFYNEGYATYVSMKLCPGRSTANYFYMDTTAYESCLDWIDTHREMIYEDSREPIAVLNEYHKRYFSTSFNEGYPNIGYVIGCEYMKYLHRTRGFSLERLRTFHTSKTAVMKTFREFTYAWERQ